MYKFNSELEDVEENDVSWPWTDKYIATHFLK
jgi:hypothetical protein